MVRLGKREEFDMASAYTAIIQRDGPWWVGWVEEIPGVNGQGATREECVESLRSALKEALELNRADAISAAQSPFEEVNIRV
jgi:predicted RNase H-like HicB family nuclease